MAVDYNKREAEKLAKAKKRIKDIKGFYSHLLVYVLVNLAILIIRFDVLDVLIGNKPSDEFSIWINLNTFGTAFFWGIGLAIHAFLVFGPQFKFSFVKRWEERKIKEFLEKEEQSKFKNY